MKRALTGIRSSGTLHIGNYLGTIKPAVELQQSYECLYFVADLHSMTTNRDKDVLHASTYDITAAFLAAGLDPLKNIIYRQSDISLVTEFSWYLSCVTGLGFLEKGHAYKDAQAVGREVNHGMFYYPVLMASDILMYDPDVVPVGKDQIQHVEMCRDMGSSFNAAYKTDAIKIPTLLVRDEVKSIPGLDGQKMSKSYDNVIPLFADEKALRKLIMSIKTDSTPVEAAKKLDGTLIGDLFLHFASKGQYADLSTRLAAGGLGWGHAKEELFVAMNNSLKDMRAEYVKLRQDEKKLEAILQEGAARAFEIARGVLNRVRKAIGFGETRFYLR